jgi:hypothetical protein
MEGQLEMNNSGMNFIKTEHIEEPHGRNPETPVTPQLQQQPFMLVPVTGIPSSQNGIFVSANGVPMTPESQNNSPMMMVYPNSSFANVGRPTRKRGRPPKVPVLTRMLSDTSKVPRFDFPGDIAGDCVSFTDKTSFNLCSAIL